MKLNNQHKVFIIGIIALISFIIPYNLFFSSVVIPEEEEESIQEEDQGKIIQEDLVFPDEYYENITQIDIDYGNIKSGSEESLKFRDNETLELYPEEILGNYYYEIYFHFNTDLNTYTLDFYDLFLYLDILEPEDPTIVSFQGYIELQWSSLYTITEDPIHLSNEFIEKCTDFRLYANIPSNKTIKIDRIRLLFAHQNPFPFKPFLSIDSHYVNLSSSSPNPSENDDDWWLDENDDLDIYQYKKSTSESLQYTELYFDVIYDVGNGKIIDLAQVKDYTLYAQYNSFGYWNLGTHEANAWIYDYTDGSWDFKKKFAFNQISGKNYTTDLAANPEKYIYEEDGDWKSSFWVQSKTQKGGSYIWVDIYLWIKGFSNYIEINGYDFEGFDYPDIEITTDPISPISYLGDFDIIATATPGFQTSTITTTSCFISNSTWSSGWLNMGYSGGNDWRQTFNSLDFQSGNYSVWVNTTDSSGLSTLNVYPFVINNSRPEINFITPKPFDKITELYNYNINVSITDLESDIIGTPQISLYQNISNPLINWTDMEQLDILKPYWNFTIDPINFSNGLYYIKVRANDTKGYGYNEISVNIQNNPPNITIISPSATILQIPHNQTIACNISNEEPINTAEWTITPTLGSYTWTNLTYNSISTLWESSFNLLDYSYGDYFLVVNASDDKHNSSLEIKNISIHPLLTYNITQGLINYKDKNIVVSNYETSTEIIGDFIVEHDDFIKERDFEVYTPNNFDFIELYLIRNTNKTLPLTISKGYSLWQVDGYQTSDLIQFSLIKPQLSLPTYSEKDSTYIFEFSITAQYYFQDINIKYEFQKDIDQDIDQYIFYIKRNAEWLTTTLSKPELDGKEIYVEYILNEIIANQTIYFKLEIIKEIPEPTEETNYLNWIITGLILLGIGEAIWLPFAYYLRKRDEDISKRNLMIAGIIIGIGAFLGGIVIGYAFF
ncbi:MAG: hypothetical protein ACFFDB_00735 [Promethearchaeota archaeon]